MSFKLKTLLAALVFTAVTAPAQAAMDTAGTGRTTDTGGSSFVLSVWNADLGSATFDLGFNYNSFASLVSQGTFNLATGDYSSAWSFISAASSAPTYWAVYAGDNVGSSRTAGSRGFFTTANSLDGMSQLPDTSSVVNVLANMDGYIGAANNAPGNHATVANGANTSTLTANSGAGSAGAYGTGKAGAAGPFARAELNQSQQMLQILIGGTAAPTANFMANASANNYTFMLSSAGLLTVAAVPEADTNAMMMLGLGMMGFMVRRRKAKQL